MSGPAIRSPGRRNWRRRLWRLGSTNRFFGAAEALTLLIAVVIAAATYFAVDGGGPSQRLFTPPVAALLLVANILPLMALMVLIARRVAIGRTRRVGGGRNGRLRVRLVATFSLVASVPTLLVVVFASLLFQYGVQFWFSDRARTVLENADRVAQAYVTQNETDLDRQLPPMLGDFRLALSQATIDDPRFVAFIAEQVRFRLLNELAIIAYGEDGEPRLIAGGLIDARSLEERVPRAGLPRLNAGERLVGVGSGDRVEGVVAIDPADRVYLYASRKIDPVVVAQVSRASSALSDYRSILARTRARQLQFNAALLVGSLLIVGAAIWIAFVVADRLVRPVGTLVDAARRVAGGDLATRVGIPSGRDEIGTLAAAFNRMTRRLEEQTGALVSANATIDSRRALTEAVLSGVTAGVIAVDGDGRVRLANRSAEAILGWPHDGCTGQFVDTVAPELAELLAGSEREAVVQLARRGGVTRTLAAKVVASSEGQVLTFDDITDQLADQRRAAWADVARRIAHEIKNPLTPIQLAAERLQRRYGREVTSDPAVFERLTATIVRQVGDLRRMVDEFSSFARMPKPVFRPERIEDILGHAVFLHEVAHPGIAFRLDVLGIADPIVCDRRQLAQAFTNIIKNAVEAIEGSEEPRVEPAEIVVAAREVGDRMVVTFADNGPGLPEDRARLTEPYVTTRARGTGLGLAIVRKIVEEHAGVLDFSDRPGGGTIVAIDLDRRALLRQAERDAEEPAEPGVTETAEARMV